MTMQDTSLAAYYEEVQGTLGERQAAVYEVIVQHGPIGNNEKQKYFRIKKEYLKYERKNKRKKKGVKQ